MGFFDELKEKRAKLADQGMKVATEGFEQAKAVAGGAIEQAKTAAGEAYDKAQKKAARLALENDLGKAQKQLGALYYLMRKTGEENEELLTRYYEEVAGIEEKLERLQAEEEVTVEDVADEAEGVVEEIVDDAEELMDEVKETIENAVEEVKETVEEIVEEVKEVEYIPCPVCGAPMPADSEYCPICGAKIN